MTHPVDKHVGNHLRIRRVELGLSQRDLGKALGIPFEQIHKYESGAIRIGSAKLYELSKILNVPVGYFFGRFEHYNNLFTDESNN